MLNLDNTIPVMEVPICHGKYKGYTWYLKENPDSGIINGYVMIKPNQNGYNHEGNYSETCDISCHGDITFDAYDGDKDRVIGFDTDHGDDYVPKVPEHNKMIEQIEHVKPHHWTQPELKKQCTYIIDQLISNPKYNH